MFVGSPWDRTTTNHGQPPQKGSWKLGKGVFIGPENWEGPKIHSILRPSSFCTICQLKPWVVDGNLPSGRSAWEHHRLSYFGPRKPISPCHLSPSQPETRYNRWVGLLYVFGREPPPPSPPKKKRIDRTEEVGFLLVFLSTPLTKSTLTHMKARHF